MDAEPEVVLDFDEQVGEPDRAAAGKRNMTDERIDPNRQCNSAALGVRIVSWAISRNPLRPGALVTAGDVCHLHSNRAAAERSGALMGGNPDLVRLEKHTARVYRVLWSLSDVAGGELRKPAPPPAPPPAKRPGAPSRSVSPPLLVPPMLK